MYPFLKPGDRVIAEKVSPASLQVGDVAIFPNSSDNLVIHRLIKILPRNKGIFKGDSRLEPDPEPVELSFDITAGSISDVGIITLWKEDDASERNYAFIVSMIVSSILFLVLIVLTFIAIRKFRALGEEWEE